jgi:H+/Cl- antiporter ClcA
VNVPRLVIPAVVLGVVNAVVFLGFEFIVKDGTHWLWDDVAGSDTARWRVLPLAIAGSVAFAVVLRAVREPRVTEVHAEAHLEIDDSKPASFRAVWVMLLVGATGLVAGASLGPEMPLFAASAALGAWVASKARSEVTKLLILSSVGALLVAFFGSLIPLLIPALLLFREQRKSFWPAIVPIVLAGLAAFGTLALLANGHGFGSLPADHDVALRDYPIAFALGVLVVPLAAVLRFLVERLNPLTLDLDRRWPWLATAAAFGTVLGVLYLVGGETVQFSGSEGSKLLLERSDDYATLAVVGIVLVKLVATSWSLTAGYRGGLVFPSVFAGIGVALVVVDIWGGAAGPGVAIGAVAGVLTAMTSAVLGPIMLLSLLPLSLLGVGLAGAAGAVAGDKLFIRVGLLPAADDDAAADAAKA